MYIKDALIGAMAAIIFILVTPVYAAPLPPDDPVFSASQADPNGSALDITFQWTPNSDEATISGYLVLEKSMPQTETPDQATFLGYDRGMFPLVNGMRQIEITDAVCTLNLDRAALQVTPSKFCVALRAYIETPTTIELSRYSDSICVNITAPEVAGPCTPKGLMMVP